MNNRRCDKCGCIYNGKIYGDLCPLCSAEKEDSSGLQGRRPTIYGPPPINNDSYMDPAPCIYGPPPLELDSYQKPQPTIYGPPPKKKLSYALVSLIIGVILGSIIAWLFKDCSSFNQSTVYGPPPVDTTQTISPVNNE